MSARLVIDNTRPRERIVRTDCFTDADGWPLLGSPPPASCPFCASGAGELQVVRLGNDEVGGIVCPHSPESEECVCTFHVDCMKCGCEGPGGMTALEAAQGWNRRAGGGEVPDAEH